MPWTPPPTSPPLGYIGSKDIPVPKDIVEQTSMIYVTGYREGWSQAAEAYKKRKESDTAVGQTKTGEPMAVAEAVTSWDLIQVAAEYKSDGLVEYIYKRGYTDGWETSWMGYVRVNS